jgi:hypothetical protein
VKKKDAKSFNDILESEYKERKAKNYWGNFRFNGRNTCLNWRTVCKHWRSC